MPSVTLIPNAYTNTGSYNFTLSTNTSRQISNAYHNADNTSSSARLQLASNRSATRTSEMYLEFDKSALEDIPASATIGTITANVRYYVSSTTYCTAVSLQLYANTSSKGSARTDRPTSSTKYSITAGSWTYSELENIRLHISATHNASTSTAYLYLYGADVTINYTLPTAYNVTASSSAPGVTIEPASQSVYQGESAYVILNKNKNIIVTDNNVDVTSQLVQRQGGTISQTAESQTNTGISSGASYAAYAVGHTAESPYSTSTSNMYASSGSTGHVDYVFDFSSIPEGVTIQSVTVKAYGHAESTTYTSGSRMAEIQLYSGSSTKGSAQHYTSTSNSIMTLSDPGTWTRDELQNAILRFTVANYGGLVLGITWTVVYEASGYIYTISNVQAAHTILVVSSGGPSYTIYVKDNGTWKQGTVYVKDGGTWKEASELKVKDNGTWK